MCACAAFDVGCTHKAKRTLLNKSDENDTMMKHMAKSPVSFQARVAANKTI